MAPTILGPHQRGVCPHCGKTATVSFHEEFDELPERGDPDEPGRAPRERLGICPSCGTAGVVPKIDKAVHGADRFIMNRLLQPRRWDLVVFRYPPEPSNIYVMRLIGMPGEEVVIKDGGVWINGVRAEPPAEIAKLTYTASLPFERDLQGAPERPAKLKADEYFVLGDFALASSDSRFWGPVPAANVEGVATLIYWPPSRWRFFR